MTRYLCAHLALIAGTMLAPVAAAAESEPSDSLAVFVEDTSPVTKTTKKRAKPKTVNSKIVDAAGDVTAGSVLEELDNNIELAQFTGGGGVGLPLGAASGCTGQWFVGAEYLNVRASFSQATAYLQTDIPAGALSAADTSYTYVQQEFDYEPNFRVYGGYRICDCGCEVRFTYTSIDSSGSFQSPTTLGGGTRTITGPFEVLAPDDGDSISGSSEVSINDYDIGFSRTIPLGSPLGACDCCDPCCSDACGCWCPAWDITWTGAIRIADIESSSSFVSNTTTTASRNATSEVNFQGVGLRTGLLGRRYFGKQGVASIYLRGDISLMLGDVENVASGTNFSRHAITTTQIVPVTELEAGATVFLTKRASVTGGYLFAAWHDLGNRPEYDFGATGVQIESWDDANILGVDGWFVRAELTY